MFSGKKLSLCMVTLSVAVMFTACTNNSGENLIIEDNQSDLSWEEFLGMVYQEPDTGIYIVNGDEPIVGERALRSFYDSVVGEGELIVNTVGGQIDKWSDSQKMNLTYCVSQSSFGSLYNTVVTAMNNASNNWEAAANGSIDLIHVTSQDGNCTASNNNVVFDVRQTSTTSYLARAFFPYQSRSTRNILISTSALPNGSGPWSLEGILEHELGHALGFRHEHTRPEAGTCFEDNNWSALTSYDSASVMHYPQCNGSQTGDLAITSTDAAGIQALYGGSTGPVCGNGVCESGENSSNCPADCGGGGNPNSCEGYCGTQAPGGCYCDAACTNFGDCCSDYQTVCNAGPTCNGSGEGGTLSGAGDFENHPVDGNTYQGFKYGYYTGGLTVTLTGPNNADFDLFLYRWTGTWTQVASSTSANSDEVVSDTVTGYYAIRVTSYSGSGSYDLCID